MKLVLSNLKGLLRIYLSTHNHVTKGCYRGQICTARLQIMAVTIYHEYELYIAILNRNLQTDTILIRIKGYSLHL